MSIWGSIFGLKHGQAAAVEVRPSGLLMDADGWYYEEALDAECPMRTIRVQQSRPGDWYVRNTNCRVAELNSPSRAAEVLEFFTGSFRWLRFEREGKDGHRRGAIRIVGSYLDSGGAEHYVRVLTYAWYRNTDRAFVYINDNEYPIDDEYIVLTRDSVGHLVVKIDLIALQLAELEVDTYHDLKIVVELKETTDECFEKEGIGVIYIIGKEAKGVED